MTYQDQVFLEKLEKKFTIVEDESYSNLVHFQTTSDIPFQRWYPYREGYSYKLVDKFIKEFEVTGALYDPFVGSGSSVLAGRYNGLETYGIDVNPISIFITKVQNRNYNNSTITQLKKKLDTLKSSKRDNKIRETNFTLAKRYFNDDVLQSLLQLKEYIYSINSEEIRDIFFMSWLSIIEKVSNMKKEGNGLKYRNRKRTKDGYINIPIEEWESKNQPSNKFVFVIDNIAENINKIIEDIDSFKFDAPEPIIELGSSIQKNIELQNEIELTIFSPPYMNFFDYFEIHKMELWLGDFVNNQKEFRKLKKTGIRSNSGSTDSKKVFHENKSVTHLTELISEKDLWSKQIPFVIAGYFDDMEMLLENLFDITKIGGSVVIVVGNSAYGGIIVPTDLLIAEIAEKIGFNVDEIIVTRHLTTSSQQRKLLTNVMDFMRESIIVLRKEK